MEFTTHLELQSQATRLFESLPYASFSRLERGYHPHWHLIPEDLTNQTYWYSFYRLQFRRFSV